MSVRVCFAPLLARLLRVCIEIVRQRRSVKCDGERGSDMKRETDDGGQKRLIKRRRLEAVCWRRSISASLRPGGNHVATTSSAPLMADTTG